MYVVIPFTQLSHRSRRTDTSYLNEYASALWRHSTQRTGPQMAGQPELGLNKGEGKPHVRGASVILYEGYRCTPLKRSHYTLFVRSARQQPPNVSQETVRTRVPRITEAAGLDPLRSWGTKTAPTCTMNGADGGVSSSLDAPITCRT